MFFTSVGAITILWLVHGTIAFVPSVTTSTTTSRPSTITTMAATKDKVGKLTKMFTTFLMCDIQESVRPLLYNGETAISTAQYMTSVAKILDMRLVVTEQDPKVFGPTVADCFASPKDLEETPVFEKKQFSMLTDKVRNHMSWELSYIPSAFVLFGTEAHVSVQQTALELLERGHGVHIVVDGVTSQQPYDRHVALQRLSDAGAHLTTAQSVAFLLMESATHHGYKKVSKLTVEHMKKTNEFNEEMIFGKK